MTGRGPRAIVLPFVVVLAGTVAIAADPPPTGPHGAAPFDVQQQRLDALLAGKTPGAVPGGVDAKTWAASVPADNQPSDERIALGRKLYFDPILSKDGTVACATCHDVTRSFTDRRPVSEGIGDQLGMRNAPTSMNAALLHTEFLDGRAATLEEQAGQPILNSIEMGNPDRDSVVARLKATAPYPELFQKAYGRELNYDDLQRAIAAFERTLIFLDAPFDKFMAGDTSAISADAQAGWVLFNGRGRCVACHAITRASPLGSDNRFHNIGVSARHQDFEALAVQALAALREDPSAKKLDELALSTKLSELGRFMVTKAYSDIGAFRTSQLRNIAITAPYMHDGTMQTLWDTVDHYNKGGEANRYLDGGVEPLGLSDAEVDQIVAFLFTLTDVRFAELNTAELGRQRDLAAKQRPFEDDQLSQRKVFPFESRVFPGTPGATHE